MAFALVNWVEENRLSIIPSAWVIKPSPVPSAGFPMEGMCYRRKKTSIHETVLLGVSDEKQPLEELMKSNDNNDEECESSSDDVPSDTEEEIVMVKRQKRRREEKKSLKKTDGEDDSDNERVIKKSKTKIEASKKDMKDKKAKKLAELQAADDMSEKIFHLQQTASCTKCSNLAQLQKEYDTLLDGQRRMDDKIINLTKKIEDKDRIITQLRKDDNTNGYTSQPPPASKSTLAFLANLYSFYTDCPVSETCNKEEKDHEFNNPFGLESDDNENVVKEMSLEQRRSENIKKNKENMKELGIPIKGSSTIRNKYEVSPADLQKEQQAFEAGEGKKELVQGYGVYVKFVDLEMAEQTSKDTATGLMRAIISIFYSRERLATCSANSGINSTIRTAVFKYCELQYPKVGVDKLKRDLTSKCCEERRKLSKS